MASNGGNEVSLCQGVLYHSASGRARCSNDRYFHVSTPPTPQKFEATLAWLITKPAPLLRRWRPIRDFPRQLPNNKFLKD